MQKALFLDRDGIIIQDAGYLRDASLVQLIPTAAELIKRAREKNYAIVVVTNQSGIGRSWISLENYQEVSARMIDLLAEKGAKLDRIYFAPFYVGASQCPYPESDFVFQTSGVPQEGAWSDQDRKPNPGMLIKASRAMQLDLSGSVMVGDRVTDLAAAHNAGLRHFYFRRTEVFEDETRDLDIWKQRLARFKSHEFTSTVVDLLTEVPLP